MQNTLEQERGPRAFSCSSKSYHIDLDMHGQPFMHSLRILIKYAHSQAPVGYPEAMTLCGGWESAALEYTGKATRLFSASLVHLHSLNVIIYHRYTTKHVCWVMLSHKV